METAVARLWASTRLHVWPETMLLVSLPRPALPDAARLVASLRGSFAALVVERDEVSLTVPQDAWRESALRSSADRVSGPLRAISLDLDLDLSVVGYLAPAALRLAEAGVSIVPQCAFLKDHLLVHAGDLELAVRTLGTWIEACGPPTPF